MKKNKAKVVTKASTKLRCLISLICFITVALVLYFIFSKSFIASNEVLNTHKSQNLLNVCDGVSVACGNETEETTKPVVEDVKKDDSVDSVPSPVRDIESVINDDIAGESTDHIFGTGLTVKFPMDWKIEHTKRLRQYLTDEPNFESNDRTLLTSPDGQATVKFELIMQGEHGGPKYDIVPYDGYELKTLDYEALPDYSNLYFASYLVKYGNNSSMYYVGINSNIEIMQRLRAGDFTGSDLLYHEINPVSSISDRTIVLWLEARCSSLDINSSASDFESIKSTSNYEIAKQIIESLHIKK